MRKRWRFGNEEDEGKRKRKERVKKMKKIQ